MRSRNIKPGFFKNEILAECSPLSRILFTGLWCMADRKGRLEYRPKRIKAEILPYDNSNIDKLLSELLERGFINIYSINNEKYIEIIKFVLHQNPNIKECESTIPAPCEHSACTEEELLIPDSLLPLTDSLLPLTPKSKKEYSTEFLSFYEAYPNKKEKPAAFKAWLKMNGTRPALEVILLAIQKQVDWRKRANGCFRPEWKHPATWLSKGCWDDELQEDVVDWKKSDKTSPELKAWYDQRAKERREQQ